MSCARLVISGHGEARVVVAGLPGLVETGGVSVSCISSG